MRAQTGKRGKIMYNILFVHSSSELYGSDRSLLNIVTNINKEKYKPFVLLPCEGSLASKMREVKDVDVLIYDMAILRRKNLSIKGVIEYIIKMIHSVKYIKNTIINNKINIVETNTAVTFAGAIAAKKMKIFSIWHIREIITNKLENAIISLVMNTFSDIIIANSKATGDSLHVNSNKIRVVYNAIDDVEEKTEIKKDNDRNIIIGMAGRINRWKGQKLFVDAAEIVLRKYPDTVFYIAGDSYKGEEIIKEDLKNYISQKKIDGSIKMLGQVDDMNAFYDKIDIFVLPSIKPEPFGLVVIEAMRAGIPVIATNHGGPVEIIDDGKDGFLVESNDKQELAKRMIMLVSDISLREKMGNRGKQKQQELFSIRTMMNNLEKVYEECINKI